MLDVSKGYTKLHLAIDQSQDSSQGEWFVQPSFYTGSGGSTQLTLKKSSGILLASTKSIVLGGAEGPAVKVELTAGKELLLSCGESSLQMQSGSGDIQMYANEVKLESPRNATPLDLLSQDEVALLPSEYEKQKTDYLTNNILYYMDASGYTGVDIDQARQTTAYKIIDGLANCGKELDLLYLRV